MKKLLLTIAIACMGCGEECATLDPVFGPVHSGCEQTESCGYFKEWNECTCQCEWNF